jgi:hypothetical protein
MPGYDPEQARADCIAELAADRQPREYSLWRERSRAQQERIADADRADTEEALTVPICARCKDDECSRDMLRVGVPGRGEVWLCLLCVKAALEGLLLAADEQSTEGAAGALARLRTGEPLRQALEAAGLADTEEGIAL